jgi:hypothetical protein
MVPDFVDSNQRRVANGIQNAVVLHVDIIRRREEGIIGRAGSR